MSTRKSDSLNQALKQREELERQRLLNEVQDGKEKAMALDDTQRVKVLSPGRLVAKRFFRNKLAMVGLIILITMFIFSFICPIFYPYSQTQIFYKYDKLNIDYASVTERTENVSYVINPEIDIHYSVANRINSYISEMEEAGQTSKMVSDDAGVEYLIQKQGDKVYTVSASKSTDIAVYSFSADVGEYSGFNQTFNWKGEEMDEAFQSAVVKAIGRLEDKTADFNYGGDTYTVTLKRKNTYSITRSSPEITYAGEPLGDAFEEAVTRVIEAGGAGFNFNGDNYHIRNLGDSYSIYAEGDSDIALVASTFVFDLVDNTMAISDEFKSEALLALYDGGTFDYNGAKYTVVQKGDDIVITDKKGKEVAQLNTYSVRRYSGQDTLDLDFKDSVIAVIENMLASNQTKATFNHKLPAMDEKANYVYDKDGNLTYDDTELTITRTPTQYVVNCEQTTYLIDIHSAPTKDHWLGTDGDGMDILARAMYGGRISLMVSFVVVILEMILGIIMGGIAGFFGGIVDTVIMRLVDIFYCIPSMPILIITGAFFDAMKMNAYVRLVYLMAILGILGWAGVARLVRGQILSLREQEFMVAEESTGMRAGKRIFRHLVPNVMPQLIVSATMGLGSVIITESTLSFLGLGVKHPLATWGNMINSVTGSSEDMIKYTYIWIPIGMLICLTVIAFNFVGDGLRDAFDPKMKQ